MAEKPELTKNPSSSAQTSKSKATYATEETTLSNASTPTATSTSPKPSTTLTSLTATALGNVFKGLKAKVLVLAFKSDWLYPAYQSQEIVKACKLAGVDASYCEINSTYGHDSFLLETEQETQLIGDFLKVCSKWKRERQPNMTKQTHVIEHKVISSWISSGASVLDLGCGDGELSHC